MISTDVQARPVGRRPPPPIAWILLLASAAAVLVTGLVATGLVLYRFAPSTIPLSRPIFWVWLPAAFGLTLASLGLRALRWVFLLRRSETRIPIRDAFIAYLAGFALLLAPVLLGEIATRAYVHRQRGAVPVLTTVVLNIWERLIDTAALVVILAGTLAMLGEGKVAAGLSGVVAATLVLPVRRFCLRAVVAFCEPLVRAFGHHERLDFERLTGLRTWVVSLATSVVAWSLPGVALWGLAGVWAGHYSLPHAERDYSSSALAGALSIAPGGIIVAGRRLLDALGEAGLAAPIAALAVLGIRLATAGVSTVLGAVFLLVHVRSRPNQSSHFDEIAEAYDVQIPLVRREALLARKTTFMSEIIEAEGLGRRGLDVGCGQGWYVGRMRERGFDVVGIDASARQVQLARRNLGSSGLVQVGSVLDIPAPDSTYDFVYTINVLHHLGSVQEQRAAFTELMRVLRPGGLLFVHEINTRNVLFRFYMGYVFPSVNCIDEGVERWLLPHALAATYTDVPVIDIRYFTFLPDFVPAAIVRFFTPLERRLEASTLGIYSAHYMAALRKP